MQRADGIAIELDGEACAGAGECAFRAPHTFRVGERGKATIVDPDGDPAEAVLLAARTCPTFAITLRRAGHRLTKGSDPSR